MPMAADISRSCDSSSAGQLKDCTVYVGSLNILCNTIRGFGTITNL